MSVRVQATSVILALSTVLGGCAQVGIPLGPGVSNEITGSIRGPNGKALPVVGKNAVDPSDWETVRRTIVTAMASGENKSLDWTNPDTGSSGTITPSVELAGEGKPNCRLFATTLNDFRGVRRFRGEICRQGDGRWQLVTVSPDDAALS